MNAKENRKAGEAAQEGFMSGLEEYIIEFSQNSKKHTASLFTYSDQLAADIARNEFTNISIDSVYLRGFKK